RPSLITVSIYFFNLSVFAINCAASARLTALSGAQPLSVPFEIGEFSKKYNMQMHILIPAIKYDHKYQLQFEIDASAIEQKP
ncbi:NEAT domain-containing protein, partial [Bacillus mobilis]|uniref:NEAT domain-containing protein n=1 Tax=Bacillus mobilis TaxID=2026190 RepID=UPI00240DB0C6